MEVLMALRNPMTGGLDWYHGSPHDFDAFRGARAPHEYDDNSPWNCTLGDHFSAHHETASEFAQGLHNSVPGRRAGHPLDNLREPSDGQVYHARLHVSKPIYFDNEDDFDRHARHVLQTHVTNGGSRDVEASSVYLHWLKSNGHDSIVYGNDIEGPKGHPCIIVPKAKSIEVTQKHSVWTPHEDDADTPKGPHWGRYAARDQASCPHDGGWNLHGQCRLCGYIPPTEGDEPCDNPWCVAHEPEHTKAEHIDPPHQDPGHEDYQWAQRSIEDALGNHPDAWLFDHQSEGPTKWSKKAAHDPEPLHHWLPTKRLFAPTKDTLDPDLFDGDHLKPQVREALIDLYANWWRTSHPTWRRWARIFFTGSQASYWWGNHDFDTLVGVNYAIARTCDPKLAGLTDEQIDDTLNAEFRHGFNNEDWRAPWPCKDPIWHLTGYVNTASWDIAKIKPYAAYDVIADQWVVHPDRVDKDWSVKSFGEGFIERAEQVIRQIQRIQREPNAHLRAMEGQTLWDYIHGDRSRAFGPHGTGWKDPGNALEKYLDQSGWLKVLHDLKVAGDREFGQVNLLDRKDGYDPAKDNALGTSASTNYPWSHDGHEAGKGKNRQRPTPQGGGGSGAADQDASQPVEEGVAGRPAAARWSQANPAPLIWHRAAEKDIRGVHPKVVKKLADVLAKLQVGERHPQTHPLAGDLKGWDSSPLGHNHRVVHRYTDEGLEVGWVGAHENDDVPNRRLSASEYEPPEKRQYREQAEETLRAHLAAEHPNLPQGAYQTHGFIDLMHRREHGTIGSRGQMTLGHAHDTSIDPTATFTQRYATKGCPACSGTGEQGTGHECYACDGTGSADAYDPTIDNANPENGLLVGRDDAKGIAPVTAAVPLKCSDCDQTYFTDSMDDLSHQGCSHKKQAATRTLTQGMGPGGDAPDGVMVHLVPPMMHIEPLLPEDGEHIANAHVTLAYLGGMAEHSEEQLRRLPELVEAWAEGQQPIDGSIQGLGTFVNTDNPNEDERHVLWAGADLPGSPRMYVSLHDFLKEHGYSPRDNHGFVPHITLAYGKHHFRFLPKLDERKPWPVREVWLAIGSNWQSFPLGS